MMRALPRCSEVVLSVRMIPKSGNRFSDKIMRNWEETIMTPQERQLVDELFDKLAKLESTPRDRDAEHAIADGLARAPSAVYALVQTALVQDEALKRADARIRELTGEDEAPREGGGFLDSMRNALTGGSRGSVPSVRPG